MPRPAEHIAPNLRAPLKRDYILYPYTLHGHLVFDDPAFDLVAEEFVQGTDDLIRYLAKDKKEPAFGISSTHRPSSDHLVFLRTDPATGYHYYATTHIPEIPEIGLCPNFLHYYPTPPPYLWINVWESAPSE